MFTDLSRSNSTSMPTPELRRSASKALSRWNPTPLNAPSSSTQISDTPPSPGRTHPGLSSPTESEATISYPATPAESQREWPILPSPESGEMNTRDSSFTFKGFELPPLSEIYPAPQGVTNRSYRAFDGQIGTGALDGNRPFSASSTWPTKLGAQRSSKQLLPHAQTLCDADPFKNLSEGVSRHFSVTTQSSSASESSHRSDYRDGLSSSTSASTEYDVNLRSPSERSGTPISVESSTSSSIGGSIKARSKADKKA